MASPPGPKEPSASERLDSWKEIAAYLKREVRTVRRWEKAEGLPVRRHAHNRQATVYAYKSELDAWWSNRQPRLEKVEEPAARPWLWWVGAAGALGVVVALGSVLAWRRITAGPAPAPAKPAPVIRSRLFARATAENSHITWIPVGRSPQFAFLKPDGTEVYIGTSEGVQVISVASNAVTRTLALPTLETMRLSPDGRSLYVGTNQGKLLILDTTHWQVRTLETGASIIRDLAVTPAGDKVYLACGFGGLERLLTRTLELSTIRGVACPTALGLTPDGARLYVNYQCEGPGGWRGHDAIDVMDVTTERFLETITGLPNTGSYTAVSPDGTEVWAEAGDACSSPEYDHAGCPAVPSAVVNVLRTSPNQRLRSLAFPVKDGGAISFLADSSRAILGGSSLKVVDTTTLTTVEQLPLESTGMVAWKQDGTRAYVPAYDRNAVAVLELEPEGCAPPPAGLAHWWPGDGNANDVRADLNATLENGARLAPGLVGQAFLLDGLNDTVRVPKMNLAGSASAELALGAWVKFRPLATVRNSPLGPAFVLHGRPGHSPTGTAFAVYISRDQRFVFRWGSTEIASTTRAEADRWWQVFGVKAGDSIFLYVNGVREGGARLGKAPAWDSAELRIGSQVKGGFLHGLVDEVQLYHRALSEAEVTALFRAGPTGLCYQ